MKPRHEIDDDEDDYEEADDRIDLGTVGSIYQLNEKPDKRKRKKPVFGFFKNGQEYI